MKAHQYYVLVLLLEALSASWIFEALPSSIGMNLHGAVESETVFCISSLVEGCVTGSFQWHDSDYLLP